MNYWTVPFEAHGKKYEIRIVFDGLTFRLRVFCDGKPSNRYEYSVTLETAMEMETYTGVKAVEELIKTATDHVQRGV